MKTMGFIGTAALALLLAGSTAYAQGRGDGNRDRGGRGERSSPRGGGSGGGDRGNRSAGGDRDRSGSRDRARPGGNDRGDRNGGDRNRGDRNGGVRNGGVRNGGVRNGGVRNGGGRNGGIRGGSGGHVQLPSTPDRQRQWNSARSNSWRSHRARDFSREHRNWGARGGYHGYRIPSSFFRSHFGRSHYFRVRSLPFVVVGGRPSFQYDGYWFDIVDPYPEYWGDDWWDTDEVYVDYVNDGYYMFNRRFPDRPGIAISIRL
jgi:hypothetical protein